MFRFTTRELLWLMVVVMVSLAGLIAYCRVSSENRHLEDLIEAQSLTIADLTIAAEKR